MKLIINGANVRYTLEQLAQTLFGGRDISIICDVSRGKKRITSSCILTLDGKNAKACAWSPLPDNDYDINHAERLTSARAFYKASLEFLGSKPSWGMLSGVRPAKLVRARLEAGDSLESAEKFLQKTYFVSPEKSALCAVAGNEAFQIEKSLDKRDVLLYVHIPFCPSRCSYCSFVSMSAGDYAKYGEAYFTALSREFDAFRDMAESENLNVRSVYIGGGTPAILEPQKLASLCGRIRALAPNAEFTVEAGRPDAITAQKLDALKSCGVSRICVNTQTVHDKTLELIGRKHTGADFFKAFDLARRSGFESINVDLIAGLPGEDIQDFCDSVDSVLALSPENITVHTLAVKRSSFLNEAAYKNTSSHMLHEMLDYASAAIGSKGYKPYYIYRQKNMGGSFENIGFTLPDNSCFYNICMMEEIGDVVALGAGASSKLTAGSIYRRINPKYPKEYIGSIESVLASFDDVRRYFNEK